MASIYDIYTGYLEAEDLKGKSWTLEISEAFMDDVYNARIKRPEKKVIVRFKKVKKVFALNKTQAEAIADIAGENYEKWEGYSCTLSQAKTHKGQDTIDVSNVTAPGAKMPGQSQPPAPASHTEPPKPVDLKAAGNALFGTPTKDEPF